VKCLSGEFELVGVILPLAVNNLCSGGSGGIAGIVGRFAGGVGGGCERAGDCGTGGALSMLGCPDCKA